MSPVINFSTVKYEMYDVFISNLFEFIFKNRNNVKISDII